MPLWHIIPVTDNKRGEQDFDSLAPLVCNVAIG